MRAAALPLLAALGVVAACATDSRPVSQSAPTVAYRIAGNDVTQANANAARYCQRYGASPQLQSVQQSPSGNVAVYTCTSASGGTAGAAPPPAYAAPGYAPTPSPQPGYAQQPSYGSGSTVAPPVQCADRLHRDRPGGTDYQGPPVPECPRR